tara:strand:- start:622 stop:828 length:207 start_codon:yes stop_codon:yes gene_type:complete
MHPKKIPNIEMMIVMYLYLCSYALYPNIPKKKYSITCSNLSHVKAKTGGTDLPGIDDTIKIKKRYKKN